MTLPLRLSLVTLGVADVARSTLFYETLGLKASSASNDSVTFFNTDGPILSIFSRAALAHDAEMSEGAVDKSGEPVFSGLSLAWNLASEPDVDKALIKMIAAGGRLIKTAERAFWGGYSGYAQDPDGHLWEVAYNPGFAFDAASRLRAPD